MNSFIIRPLDPLVFGIGKPFGAIPGARIDSSPVPPPSTLAGMVRTETGRDASGRFDRARIEELLEYTIHGPLPVVDGSGAGDELAVPAPADALRVALDDPTHHELLPLRPLELQSGDGISDPAFVPVGLTRPLRRKPPRGVPAWWRLSALLDWLVKPSEQRVPATWGVSNAREEVRTHVRIDAQTSSVAEDAALFGTVGRRFHTEVDGALQPLAIWGATDAPLPLGGCAVLGGEGRLSRLKPSSMSIPEIPPEVVASARAGAVRAVLLTPAPLGGCCWEPEGASVAAQAHGRPLVVSGWGMAPRNDDAGDHRYRVARRVRGGGQPKPTRRLVPAGAVFFLTLSGDPDTDERWARSHWGSSLCHGQEARDGFGLLLLGTWDGLRHPLEMSQ